MVWDETIPPLHLPAHSNVVLIKIWWRDIRFESSLCLCLDLFIDYYCHSFLPSLVVCFSFQNIIYLSSLLFIQNKRNRGLRTSWDPLFCLVYSIKVIFPHSKKPFLSFFIPFSLLFHEKLVNLQRLLYMLSVDVTFYCGILWRSCGQRILLWINPYESCSSSTAFA